MKKILVINPNTTVSLTDMVLASCRQAHPEVTWDGVTARFGAAYIASETAYAVAAHGMLDAYSEHYSGHDAVLIACFGDPGLLALREMAPVPVLGLAEASFKVAAAMGPFAVVTGGKAWGPMLKRLVRMHVLGAQLVGIETVELTGMQIAAAPERAADELCTACQRGVDAGARSIVLGGAALAGLAGMLQPRMRIPLLDNVLLGARAAAHAAASDAQAVAMQSGVSGTPYTGISPALAKLLA